jgi:ATP-dependent protease HslVU (ClpYQ), ATPase subunit
MSSLTTNEVVEYLDQYVIGQQEAKRAVALAYRERMLKADNNEAGWRYITPNNVLMVGPSGSGKTELARQLADMTNSPFVKCEITEFTQVGYYGRDVKTILTDLVNEAIRIAPEIWAKENKPKLSKAARDMLNLMLKSAEERTTFSKVMGIPDDKLTVASLEEALINKEGIYRKIVVPYHWYGDTVIAASNKKSKPDEPKEPEPNIITDALAWAKWYQNNKLNTRGFGFNGSDNELHREAAILLSRCAPESKLSEQAIIDAVGDDFNNKRKKIMGQRSNLVGKYLKLLTEQKDTNDFCAKILRAVGPHTKVSLDQVIDISSTLRTQSEPPADFIVKLVEERGIVFIDEFDKIFVDLRGSNVGNMGVVRDLMPYLDGVISEVPTVSERDSRGLFGGRGETYTINTANILWIASGAFHLAKVTDVPAEILGRLPVHVKLNQLTADDLEKVLIKPHGSIISSVTLVMKAEGADFTIEPTAIRAIADLAFECNTKGEDTGARRLKGVCFELFKDMLYGASNLLPDERKVVFTQQRVIAERERILAAIEPRKVKKTGIEEKREDMKLLAEAIDGISKLAAATKASE